MTKEQLKKELSQARNELRQTRNELRRTRAELKESIDREKTLFECRIADADYMIGLLKRIYLK